MYYKRSIRPTKFPFTGRFDDVEDVLTGRSEEPKNARGPEKLYSPDDSTISKLHSPDHPMIKSFYSSEASAKEFGRSREKNTLIRRSDDYTESFIGTLLQKGAQRL
uniref:Uncharacterized protein n=1 Tax=Arundo donax TaxID=35708 RepID=A0A0A9DVY5_ARUDO